MCYISNIFIKNTGGGESFKNVIFLGYVGVDNKMCILINAIRNLWNAFIDEN